MWCGLGCFSVARNLRALCAKGPLSLFPSMASAVSVVRSSVVLLISFDRPPTPIYDAICVDLNSLPKYAWQVVAGSE